MTTYKWRLTRINADSPELDAWSAIYREQDATPLLHPDFLHASLTAFGGRGMRLGICMRADEVVAACILGPFDVARITTFQPSQAPIGFWLQREELPMVELLRSLSKLLSPWTLSIAVTQQDPSRLMRPECHNELIVSDYIDTARISINTDWESYWGGRGSNLRHNIKRANAKLANAGKTVELRVITKPTDIPEAVAIYADIESRSWKASEGTAVGVGSAQARFYSDLLGRFATRRCACCFQLLIDGQTAATDLCIRGKDEIIILKTTYDTEFKDFSPAFLMRELAFKRLFAESWCRRIEFYGRVMDWHLKWTDEVRQMYHVTTFRYAGVRFLWQAIKRLNRSARTQASGGL